MRHRKAALTGRGTARRHRRVRGSVLLLLAVLLLPRAGRAQDRRITDEAGPPNVILFLADDAGWHDVGYHGSEIRTPHIDRLARDGVRLNQFYVYPTCSPTRAALIAGRPPSRFGILGPIGGDSRLALPTDTPTLPDVLARRGYQTAITGKWHLGLRPEVGPSHYGFDYSYGYLHGQIDPYTHRYKYGDQTWHRNGEFIKEVGHVTDLIADEAVRFIREGRDGDRPFFLYVPFSVPHYPLHEPAEYIDLYRDKIPNRSRRRFAASMTHMDVAIGHVLEVLREEGLQQNTLVIFASDNGGQRAWMDPGEEYEGRYAPHERLGDNRPLRGWKGDLYEGGIRVPAVMYWPGRLEPHVASQPVIVYDLLPTLAHLAGASPEDMGQAEGVDVWASVTEGTVLDDRPLYWRTRGAVALRYGRWKLIREGDAASSGTTELYELYDLAADPNETQNVAADHPDVLARLKQVLIEQAAEDRLAETE